MKVGYLPAFRATAAVLAVAVVAIRLLPFAFDDAYIHFRIAENLATHGVPYFNTAEPVLATSSPVWTCALAPLALLPVSLPTLVALLNSVLSVLGAVLWSSVLQRVVGRRIPGACRWLFGLVYVGILLPSSAGLMETPLAVLLLGWASLLLIDGRPCAWLVLAVAIFTRYELVVFASLAAAVQLVTARTRLLRRALMFMLPVGVLSVLLIVFFATPIPQAITAKQVVYSLSRERVFHDALFMLVPRLDEPILGLRLGLPSWVWVPFVCFFAGAVWHSLPLSSIAADRRQRWGLCIGASGVLVAGAYVLKHVFLHEWYAPLFCVPLVFVAFAVAHTSKLARVLAVALSVLPVVTVAEHSLAAMGCTRVLRIGQPGARVQRYMEVGTLLDEIFPGARLMAAEIGGLGYSFRGTILDGVGLITPAAVKYHPLRGSEAGIGGVPSGLVRELEPELIVSYPVFLLDVQSSSAAEKYVRLKLPAFAEKYRGRLAADHVWGCRTLSIFVRRDIADDERIGILTSRLGATLDSSPNASPAVTRS